MIPSLQASPPINIGVPFLNEHLGQASEPGESRPIPEEKGIEMGRFLTVMFTVIIFGGSSLVLAHRMPERQISQASDDAEEDVIPSTVVENTPLWACCDCPASGYICHITGTGLRFTDVEIPQGAIIDSAWLAIMPFIITNDDIACTTYCEDADDCSTFVTGNQHNISNRARTTNKVMWYKRGAGSNWINSCNLADIVQEVVSRPGWSSGNALAFILIPGDSAGEWRSNLQMQAWEVMDHSYGAKFNCVYTSSDAPTEEESAEPHGFSLLQNHPNPFNQSTKILFTLRRPSFVSLEIYDLLGRRVETLVSERLSSGDKSVCWDGKNARGKEVSSGIYYYRLKTAGSSETKRMLLLK
jgi:hypothetical protein